MRNANELLKEALDELIAQDRTICQEFCAAEPWGSPPIIQEIRAFLAAEPEAEPVAWYHPSGDGYDSNFRDHEVVKSCTGNPWTGWIPLYTRPESE